MERLETVSVFRVGIVYERVMGTSPKPLRLY